MRLVRFRFSSRSGVLNGFRVAGEGGWETGHRCGWLGLGLSCAAACCTASVWPGRAVGRPGTGAAKRARLTAATKGCAGVFAHVPQYMVFFLAGSGS